MKLVEVEPASIGTSHCWKSAIIEFDESGMTCAEVTDFKQSLTSAYNALRRAAKASGLPVAVFMRNRRIYIRKVD